MTHNTREEMIAFVEVDGVGVALFQGDAGLKLTVSGSKEFVKEIPLHHQLQQAEQRGEDRMKRAQEQTDEYYRLRIQKARQDWLREEIVKLEGVKKHRKFDMWIGADPEPDIKGHNQALQTIIDRYQAELDQDNT